MDHFSFFYIHKERNETTYYQRNRYAIINIAKDYYKNDQESLRNNARDQQRHLSEVEKNKKREYGRYTHHNISKQKNQKLKEYQKKLQ